MKEKYHNKMHDKMMSCGCHTADDGTMSCSTDTSNMDCSMMDRKHDMKLNKMHDKMSDKSKRLKAMIMAKYDISDERLDEIKMKYRETYGDLSDERKAEIHDRISEMRDFKAELRDRAQI